MTDLTERLAAKLGQWLHNDAPVFENDHGEYPMTARDIAANTHTLLPLLLSEPELVASLPDAVRRGLLVTLVRAELSGAVEPPRNDYAFEVWGRALNLLTGDGNG